MKTIIYEILRVVIYHRMKNKCKYHYVWDWKTKYNEVALFRWQQQTNINKSVKDSQQCKIFWLWQEMYIDIWITSVLYFVSVQHTSDKISHTMICSHDCCIVVRKTRHDYCQDLVETRVNDKMAFFDCQDNV